VLARLQSSVSISIPCSVFSVITTLANLPIDTGDAVIRCGRSLRSLLALIEFQKFRSDRPCLSLFFFLFPSPFCFLIQARIVRDGAPSIGARIDGVPDVSSFCCTSSFTKYSKEVRHMIMVASHGVLLQGKWSGGGVENAYTTWICVLKQMYKFRRALVGHFLEK
jgi:hypothetical protein